MFRQRFLWAVFAGCLLILLTAMGWVSLAAVRLERAEAEARQRGLLEERVRLALWRMDSSLAPLLVQESARSFAAYQAFLPADLRGPPPRDRPTGASGCLRPCSPRPPRRCSCTSRSGRRARSPRRRSRQSVFESFSGWAASTFSE